MARIRTINPSFFRHEKLQELGPIHMLVFAGLWCQCDKAGNFEWKPRQLKLDILPFVDFDMGSICEALGKSGEVLRYTGPDGREYGHIPTFLKYQRISGKEAQAEAKYPPFSGEIKPKTKGEEHGKQSGSTCEEPGCFSESLEYGVRSMEYGSPADSPPGGEVAKRPRDRDPIWDTLVELFGFTSPHPPEEASRIGKAVRFLKAKSASPETMRRRFAEAKKRWDGKAFGPEGLTKHWDALGSPAANGVVVGNGFITSHGKTKRVIE